MKKKKYWNTKKEKTCGPEKRPREKRRQRIYMSIGMGAEIKKGTALM